MSVSSLLLPGTFSAVSPEKGCGCVSFGYISRTSPVFPLCTALRAGSPENKRTMSPCENIILYHQEQTESFFTSPRDAPSSSRRTNIPGNTCYTYTGTKHAENNLQQTAAASKTLNNTRTQQTHSNTQEQPHKQQLLLLHFLPGAGVVCGAGYRYKVLPGWLDQPISSCLPSACLRWFIAPQPKAK